MMAKPFGTPASAPAARPMPRPAGLGGIDMERAATSARPAMSSDRYDMAMSMLKAAMSGAGQSNSPALAFLTPILGAAMGNKIADKRDAAVAAEQGSMAESLLGGQINPQARAAMDVLNNPDAPDYLKTIAGTMLKKNVSFGGTEAAPRRRSAGGGSTTASAGGERLMGSYVGADGNLYGRTRDGVMKPYKDEAGNPMPAKGGTKAAPVATPGPLPADPVLPADPGLGGANADDDLINKYLGNG